MFHKFFFMFVGKGYKSEAQKEKEHKRRMAAKFDRSHRFSEKKERKSPAYGGYAIFMKIWPEILGLFGTLTCIILLPFGLIGWARDSARAKRAKANRSKAKSTASEKKNSTASAKKQGQKPENSQNGSRTGAVKKAAASGSEASGGKVNTAVGGNASAEKAEEKQAQPAPKATAKEQSHAEAQRERTDRSSAEQKEQEVRKPLNTVSRTEPDADAPKSTPQNEGDRYVRRRMTVAGSRFCDQALLDTLSAGAIIDLVAEPDNPYDKNAVRLTYGGEKIGYAAKADCLMLSTCLRLGDKIYGIITDISGEGEDRKYEYEAWLS